MLNECNHEGFKLSTWHVDINTFGMLFLWMIHLPIAVFFGRALVKNNETDLSKNTFIQSTLTFIVLSTLSITVTTWNNLVPGKSDSGSSISHCAAADFFVCVVPFLTFMSLFEVLILKLRFAFANTTYAVPERQMIYMHSAVATTTIFGVVVLIIRALCMQCFMEIKNGTLSQWGLAPKTSYYCNTSQSHQWMAYSIILSSAALFIVASIVLGWMFISRMKEITESSSGSMNSKINDMIVKSFVLVVSSVVNTFVLFVLTVSTRIHLFGYLSFTVNMVLMLCMFQAGQPVFDVLFGKCIQYYESKFGEKMPQMHQKCNSNSPATFEMDSTDFSSKS